MTTADARRLIGRLGGVDAKVFQQFFTTVIDEDNRDDCSTYGDEQNGRFGATPSLGSLAVADRRDTSTLADRKETVLSILAQLLSADGV